MHVVVGVVGRSLGSFVGGQVVQILVVRHGTEHKILHGFCYSCMKVFKFTFFREN